MRWQRPIVGLSLKQGSVPTGPSSAPTTPSSPSEILEAYWVSNNNLSGSGEALCSGRLSQQRPEASRHKKRALIISGDFLVRWHLDALLCSLRAPAGRCFCPDAIKALGGTSTWRRRWPSCPRGGKSPFLGWGMKSGERDNLGVLGDHLVIIWCQGASTTPA